MMDMMPKNKLIEVFPISKQRPSQPGARILSEQNLRKFIRGCTDKPSYVITKEFKLTDSFEFVIDGYYCKLSPDTDSGNLEFAQFVYTKGSSEKIYAVIQYTEADKTTGYQILDLEEGETGSLVKGITFELIKESETLSLGNNQVAFHILNVSTNENGDINYVIPLDSKVRFEQSAFSQTEVDGGEIL